MPFNRKYILYNSTILSPKNNNNIPDAPPYVFFNFLASPYHIITQINRSFSLITFTYTESINVSVSASLNRSRLLLFIVSLYLKYITSSPLISEGFLSMYDTAYSMMWSIIHLNSLLLFPCDLDNADFHFGHVLVFHTTL